MIFLNLKKYFFALVACAIIAIYPAACHAAEKQQSEWLIYVYLVGSDLETRDADASDDLKEIKKANPGKNVRVLVETGGAKKWHDNISNSELGRYTIENKKLVKLQSLKNQSMGEAKTLIDFIKWGDARYDAKHKMLIIWNHGGGPTGGVGYDELFDDSFLKIDEVNIALADAFGERAAKYFDIIGFDACLMASFNVATLISPFADYMIASEDVEPGYGWTYDQWVAQLVKNPQMSPLEVSKAIVDSYIEFNSGKNIETTTLSVIDLNKFPQLARAMADFSSSVGKKVVNNKKQMNYMERVVQKNVQSYGTTKKKPNCPEAVDMGEFVEGISKFDKKKAELVMDLLDETVVYKRNGKYRTGDGISMYYPVSKNVDRYAFFVDHSVNTDFSKVYGSMLNVLDSDVLAVLDEYQKNGNDYINFLVQLGASGENENGTEEDEEDTGDSEGDEADTDTSDEDEGESAESGEGTGGNIMNHLLQTLESSVSQPQPSSGTSIGSTLLQLVESSAKKRELSEEFKSLNDIPPKFNKKGHSYVQLTQEQLEEVSRVDIAQMMVILPDEDNHEGALVVLGFDETVNADWEKGIFTDTVDNTWICLDGTPLSVNVVNSTDDYIFYESPIKLNGEEYNMEIIYNRKDNEYRIIGMQSYNEEGLPSRVNIRLKEGDKIVPLFTVFSLNGESSDDDNEIEMDTVVYSKNSKITRESMGENSVAFTYMFYNAEGDDISSDLVYMSADDDNNIKLVPFDKFLEDNAEAIMKYMDEK